MALDEVSTKSKEKKYHVFLSFRGEDTRLNFTDHLYEKLVRKGIITFKDDEELGRGEVIKQNLLDAIGESHIAIVIISQNYASSTWCLDELQKIVDCKQNLGVEVFPIFHGVDPSDVRHQRGSFEEAFRDHELKFKGDKEKVQKWRDALRDIANLSGWNSKNQHESKFMNEIVEQLWAKLGPKLPTNTGGLVAIETKVDDLDSLLKLGLQDVRLIGIWGMGGIGKTTLADIFFNRMRSEFDYSYFLANVREVSNEGDQGLIKLQDKLVSHLKPKSMNIDTLSRGKDMIKNLLHNKKVLLVIDDVSSEIQLEILAGNQNWFGPGSRIIVTTRDKHLLTSHGLLLDIYEMRILNDQESLLLFCEKAFKGTQPPNDYLELSKKVVEYTGGLPLALKVLGSLLNGKSVEEWQATLIQIRQFPRTDVLKQLEISYHMLEDEYKTIFLNIACFFKGRSKKYVEIILGHCGLHPTIGINALIEKSLVTCDERFLGMHDLLEEMGKNIVLKESPNPGRRRWLWSLKDIDEVLSKNTGTEKVQGIVLAQTMPYEARWQLNAFAKMCNLRFLIINCDLYLQLGLKCLSSSLNVLLWERYPLKALPLDVQLDELVHLQMNHSKIEKLWNGTHVFRKLKYITLAYSKDLIETPDISGVPNLTKLYLGGCTKLVKVHHSVVQHKKLEILSLYGCISLETLPSKMEMCSLKLLLLFDCSRLRKLPDFEEKMECLSEINLKNCKNLLCLPNTISNLKSLKVINISGCSKVDRLPNNISENKALEDLDMRYTSIREVNPSLFHLENLKRLRFDGCSGQGPILKSQGKLLSPLLKCWRERDKIVTTESLILPRFISNLSSLTTLSLRDCNLKSLPEDIINLPSLERLDLIGNVNLTLNLDIIANLPKLQCLLFNGDMCGSRILLPSHVRVYPEDSAVEASVVDKCSLWKLFESCCKGDEHIEDCSPSSMFVTPPRIINQNNSTYRLIGPDLSRHDSNAYIPNDFGMGAWWGVALFVALDPLMSSSMPLMTNSMHLEWSFEPLSQDVSIVCLTASTTANSNHYLITMIMNDNLTFIQRHQSGSHHNGKSKRFLHCLTPRIAENNRLYVNVEVEGRKIRKCLLHQLGKEDFRFELLNKPTLRI